MTYETFEWKISPSFSIWRDTKKIEAVISIPYSRSGKRSLLLLIGTIFTLILTSIEAEASGEYVSVHHSDIDLNHEQTESLLTDYAALRAEALVSKPDPASHLTLLDQLTKELHADGLQLQFSKGLDSTFTRLTSMRAISKDYGDTYLDSDVDVDVEIESIVRNEVGNYEVVYNETTKFTVDTSNIIEWKGGEPRTTPLVTGTRHIYLATFVVEVLGSQLLKGIELVPSEIGFDLPSLSWTLPNSALESLKDGVQAQQPWTRPALGPRFHPWGSQLGSDEERYRILNSTGFDHRI